MTKASSISRRKDRPRQSAAEQGSKNSHRVHREEARWDSILAGPVGRRTDLIAVAAISIVGLLAYSNTFHVPFVLDDDGSILSNSAIRDWTNLKAIWRFSPCRFVVYLTMALNYRLNGLSLPGYHAVNLAVHLLTALFFYYFIRLLFQTPGCRSVPSKPRPEASASKPFPDFYIALFAALIFVAHPIQTQAVTYIIQRTASLVTLFYLLAMLFYVKFRLSLVGRLAGESAADRPVSFLWLIAALVSTVAAMFTKQNALTLPAAIALLEFFFFTPRLRDMKKVLPWLAPFLLTIFVIPATMMWTKDLNLGEITELGQQTKAVPRSHYLLTEFNVVRTYLRLLVLPIDQNLDYDYPVSKTFFEPATFFSFLLLVAVFLVGTRLFRTNRLASFGIVFFFLALLVESSVVPIDDVIFEHRVYLPSLGFFMAAAALLFSLPRWVETIFAAPKGRPAESGHVVFLSVAACLILAATVATFARNRIWRNTLVIWYDTARKSPNKARPLLNLGAAYQEREKTDIALRYYLRALELKPDYAQALANIGGLLTPGGQVGKAIEYCEAALKVNPNLASAHLNLGVALAMQRKFPVAYEHFESAANLKPENKKAYYNWGYALLLEGKYEEAIKRFQQVLRIDPAHADAHLDWGNALVRLGRSTEAIAHYQAALRIRPDYAEARDALRRVQDEDQPKAPVAKP